MKRFLHNNFSLLTFSILFLTLLIFPETALFGASRGLKLWWEKVLPALLPFFILAELLINLGGFSYLAKGLAPLCKALFHLPGEAGAAIVMGFTSGFPTGAAVTSTLLDNAAITPQEGTRLLCFTNNASPLFITVTVCTAVLDMPQAGIYLMMIHYGVSLLYGFIAGQRTEKTDSHKRNCHEVSKSTLPLGTLLKHASQKALIQVALVGCYLVFFSLICSVLAKAGVFNFLGELLAPLLKLLGIAPELGEAIFCGITEMTLGMAETANLGSTFSQNFALCAFFLSFGGFSVHAQVYAMIAQHKLLFKPYMLSCLIKGISAYLIAIPVGKSLAIKASTIKSTAIGFSPITMLIICLTLLLLFYCKGRLNHDNF